jgi:hypothetical protein
LLNSELNYQCLWDAESKSSRQSACPLCSREFEEEELSAIYDIGNACFNYDGIDPSIVQQLPSDLATGYSWGFYGVRDFIVSPILEAIIVSIF